MILVQYIRGYCDIMLSFVGYSGQLYKIFDGKNIEYASKNKLKHALKLGVEIKGISYRDNKLKSNQSIIVKQLLSIGKANYNGYSYELDNGNRIILKQVPDNDEDIYIEHFVTNIQRMCFFYKRKGSIKVSGGYGLLNTNNMFGNSKFDSIDLSDFLPVHLESMTAMFTGCTYLKKIIFGDIDTKEVRSMQSMFKDCFDLKTLDISMFDTSSVSDMKYMFSYCNSLKYLDLKNFNISFVKDLSYMFLHCVNLKSLNIENFRLVRAETMYRMFSYCKNLTNFVCNDKDISHEFDLKEL